MLKNLILLGSVSTITSLGALVPVSGAQAFTCGPYAATYIVRALDQRTGQGIRCVKFSQNSQRSVNTGIPVMIWYGEGRWGNTTYRHYGAGWLSDRAGGQRITGSAGDIYGNGEGTSGFFRANLQIPASDFATGRIRVTGAWNEEWIRVGSANYNPLPRPRTCGRNFEEYRVSDLTGKRNGSGIRCMLRLDEYVSGGWYGTGTWNGATYSHIGTSFTNSDQAIVSVSDLCDSAFGNICNNFNNGSVVFNRVQPRGYDVTGAWSERWR